MFEQDGKPRKERTLGEALAGDQKNQTSEAHHLAAHPAKLRLKNFLHDGPEMATGDGKGVPQTKPIADLVSHIEEDSYSVFVRSLNLLVAVSCPCYL